MRRFSKETLQFIKDLASEVKLEIALIPQSKSYVSPGDVLIFNQIVVNGRASTWKYVTNPNPVVLVVSNQRGNGIFLSSRNNRLLSAFHINQLSPEMVVNILKLFYDNPYNADYYKISNSGLAAIIGENYRTYNINYIRIVNKVNVDIHKLD
jgi:hypothetical protein